MASSRPFAESEPLDKPGDGLWQHYLTTVEAEDLADVESWNGSTTGILTFTGLFAATVATFVIESYQALSPDTGAQTVALLYQLVNSNNTSTSIPLSDISTGPFQVPRTAIVVNVLWFLSLIISLGCALLSTLIQEWSRSYLRDVKRRSLNQTVKEVAFNHIYIRMGIDRYKLDYAASVAVLLVHLAVALFLIGLIVFLFPINTILASFVAATTCTSVGIYVAPSLIPFFDKSCPYRTPLTDTLSMFSWLLSLFGRSKATRHLVLPQWTTSKREIPPKEKKKERGTFLTATRMSFVWARASAYLLTREGFGSLSNYVAVIADPRNKVFAQRLMKSGFVDRALRYNVQSFGTMSLSDVLGVLRLSSFCIEADGADDQDRWRTASWYISIPFAMERLRELTSVGNDYDEMQCFDVIVALTRLRKTMADCVQPAIPGHTSLRDEPETDVHAHPRLGQPDIGAHAYPPTAHSSQHPSPRPSLLGRIKAFVRRDKSTVQSRDSPPPRRSVQIRIPPVQFDDLMARIDSVEPFKLLPLYSGRDPGTHLVEANMFTLVAHVLAMPVKTLQRDGGIIYALLQRELNIEEYIRSLERERRDSDHIPARSLDRQGGPPASPEFLNVLQKLGLNTWMQPGSPFAVYDAHISYRMLLKGPLSWLANALEELAHRVTFDLTNLPAPRNPPAFPLPSIQESEQLAPFESYGYSAIWRASHAASGTSGAPTTPLNEALHFSAIPHHSIAHGAVDWDSRASGFSQAPLVVRSDEGTVLADSERSPEQ